MNMERHFLDQITQRSDWMEERLPAQPLVEISSFRRVLIEQHRGIQGYSREKIVVNVSFGCYVVCGHSLEIARMTREQIVICGDICNVSVQRREMR